MESIPPAYVVWRAGTTNRVAVPARQAGNRFLGSIKGLKIRALAGWYDNPIPSRFLAPIDCLNISAQDEKITETDNFGIAICQWSAEYDLRYEQVKINNRIFNKKSYCSF